MWPASGMWCTWHFSAKGQLSGRQCQKRGVEGEITTAGAHSVLFFFFVSQRLFLSVLQSSYLAPDLTL